MSIFRKFQHCPWLDIDKATCYLHESGMLEDPDALDFLVTYGGDMYFQGLRNSTFALGVGAIALSIIKNVIVGKSKKLKKHLCEDVDL